MYDADILNMDIDQLANDMSSTQNDKRKKMVRLHERPVAQNIGRALVQDSGI